MSNPVTKGKGAAIAFLRGLVAYKGQRCIIWPFSSQSTGYGMFGYNGKHLYAHRFMCELTHGKPPTPEHQASHSCGNGHNGCVNPVHLSWKTNSENQLDRRVHGTNQGRRKRLTPQQVAEIRSLKGVKTEVELAKQYGVSRSTIQYRWGYFASPPSRDKQTRRLRRLGATQPED